MPIASPPPPAPRLFCETFNTRIERGRGRHPVDRVPYQIDAGIAAFDGVGHVIVAGADDPVSFFAYPGRRGLMRSPDAALHVLAGRDQDAPQALARLAAALNAPAVPPPSAARPEPGRGPATSEAFARTLAALIPEDAVIVDESISFGFAFLPWTVDAPPHDWLQLTGGAIGDGLPLSTGAAVGAPGRRVITLQADGSALYTVQALWTQAREKLDVTTVILANRRYAILQGELQQVGAEPGEASRTLFDLGNPDLDWVAIAEGFGVEAASAETLEDFAALMRHANATPGPFLIEMLVP